MKYQIIFLILLFLCSCQINSGNQTTKEATAADKTKNFVCDENYDSLLLKYAQDFKPTTIDLSKSLSAEVTSLILKTDTACLQQQKQYRLFVATVLAKLYLHHLQCCNQGYDLLSMRESAAAIIIDAFRKFASYDRRNLEMLNSEVIVNYIDREASLNKNTLLQSIRSRIEIETKRINKGSLL